MSPILDLVRPCLTNALLLREFAGAEHAPSVRRQIVADLRTMEREAQARNIALSDINLIRYAVIAFTDEVAQSGPVGSYWTEHQLQAEMLGDTNAGQGFFRNLETLLASRNSDGPGLDVLEVYALCLYLGFRGKYAARVDATGFEELRKKLEDKLRKRLTVGGFPQVERPRRAEPVVVPNIPMWIAGLALLFSLVMLAAYNCNVTHQANRLKQYLETEAR